MTVSATATALVTFTTTSSVPVTATSFVTSTTTTVAACGGVTPGGGSCSCSYTVQCNTQFVDNGSGTDTSQTSSLANCIQTCDNNFNCAAFSYQRSTGTCTQLKGRYSSQVNADFTSGPITSGTCRGICTQSYKRDLGLAEGLTRREANAQPVGGKTFVGAEGTEEN
ncbi:hypothetical protein LTS18_001624 [Coniosporium uncinatum]|uniref:Uncharacterized protein n=1 Tax=Coniosporium uncinatum TaxID=93489 RepID=A0ACC3DUS3_9PEZI|nr:hypothetical protein LTS18_001624 [Coniosporium uncinatum]